MKADQKDKRDFTLYSPEMENNVPAEKTGAFTVNRTINGIPVSVNDFPENCPIEDSDALRILLTAKRRANGDQLSAAPGEKQIIH